MLIINILLALILFINTCTTDANAQPNLEDISNFIKEIMKTGGASGEHKDEYKLTIMPNSTDIFRDKIVIINYSLSIMNPTHPESIRSALRFDQDIPRYFEVLDYTNCMFNKSNYMLSKEGFSFIGQNPYTFGYTARILKTAPDGLFSFLSYSPKLTKDSSAELSDISETKMNIRNNLPTLAGKPSITPRIKNELGGIYENTNITFFAEAKDVEDSKLMYKWYKNNDTYPIIPGIESEKICEFNQTFPSGDYNNFRLKICDSSDCIEKSINYSFSVLPLTEEQKEKVIKESENRMRLIVIFVIIIVFIIYSFLKNRFLSFKFTGIAITIPIIIYLIFSYIDLKLAMTTGFIELLLLSILIPCAGYFIIFGFSVGRARTSISRRQISFGQLKEVASQIVENRGKRVRIWIEILYSKNGFRSSVIRLYRKLENICNDIFNRIKKDLKSYSIWYFTMAAMIAIITMLIFVTPKLSTIEIAAFGKTIPDTKYEHIWLYYSMMTQTFGAILAIIAMVATSNQNRLRWDQIATQKIKIFIILYSIIIILSIFGMAVQVVPPLDPSTRIESLDEAIPLIIFIAGLLLSVPAIVCLGKLVLDFIK